MRMSLNIFSLVLYRKKLIYEKYDLYLFFIINWKCENSVLQNYDAEEKNMVNINF